MKEILEAILVNLHITHDDLNVQTALYLAFTGMSFDTE
jgi:hypothetical protein